MLITELTKEKGESLYLPEVKEGAPRQGTRTVAPKAPHVMVRKNREHSFENRTGH